MLTIYGIFQSYSINAFVNNINNITPVDCIWGEWGEWSTCSATCGGGSTTRTRTEATPESNGGAPCTGSATDTAQCNLDECPGRKYLMMCQSKF